jgi:(2R)-3-sulfolactate dehydrogenase (NADP+)
VDIAPLKAAEGPPHDIGDYYLLVDPDVWDGAFHDRLAQVADAVAQDAGARMPGQGRRPADPAEVDDAAWAQARALAGG